MIPLDAFLPEIRSKAPGCPDPASFLAIRQACDEICRRAKLWRYSTTAPIDNDGTVDFDVPDQAQLVDFESVQFNDCNLQPKDIAWLDRCMRGWRQGKIDGIPRFYTQLCVDSLTVTPIETGILNINMLLKPSMDCDEVPDFLFTQYHELVAWGALARLLQTPNQPFTDVQMGAAYAQAFDQKVGAEMWKTVSGQERAPIRQRGQFM